MITIRQIVKNHDNFRYVKYYIVPFLNKWPNVYGTLCKDGGLKGLSHSHQTRTEVVNSAASRAAFNIL